MKHKLVKKLVSSIVIACLLFSSFGVAFGASASITSDSKGHWAEAQISAWMDKGLIKGYEDGSFKPENKITRAEFIALINRSFGFTEETAITFSDVQEGHWAYPEIAKAVKAGYITGYTDGTIGVSKPISRQEVAAIVDRLLGLSSTDHTATTYTDSADIALWAKESVEAIIAEEIMSGYSEDNSFKPANSITRAEAVVTLDKAIEAQAVVVYNKAGTYGPETGIATVNKNVAVHASGVTLQNMVINGDLLLGEGIGNGDAFLNNVKVTGTVTVQGGGENSIHFNNSVLIDIIIDKKTGTGMVRIVSEGTTTVALVIVNSPVNIQENNSTGAGFGDVNISDLLPTGSTVTLAGSFDTVNVSAQQIIVDVPEGTIENVNANSTATGMALNLSQGATINNLLLDAIVQMLGQGTIVVAVVNVPGTTFQTPPQETTQPPTSTPPTPTQETPPSVVVVTSITVTGAGSVSTVASGTTLQMSAAVAPTNATNKAIAWTVAAGTGTAMINATGLLTATSIGSVTVTATNAASGVTGTKVITVTAEPLIAEYMNAATIGAVEELLAENELGLTLTNYADLDAIGKTEVATALFNAKATLTTQSLIQSEATAAIGTAKTASDERAEESISLAIEALVADTIRAENRTLYTVTTDLNLVTTGENGTTIEWSSDENQYVGENEDMYWAINLNTGEVTRRIYYEGDSYVYLTATITKGNGTPQTKGFEVIVLKDTWDGDKRLMTLDSTDVTLSPEFFPDEYSYSATVPFSVTSTTISATTMNPDATIGDNLGVKELEVGNNQFDIYVSPANHGYYDIYTIQIRRQSEEETAQLAAQAAAIAVIEAYEGEDIDLLEVLGTALNGGSVYEENLELYKAAIEAAVDGALDTSDEISELIESINDEVYDAEQLAAIAALVAEYTNADDVEAVQALFGDNELYLDFTDYEDLDADDKVDVATALFDTKDELTSVELIQSALTTAIGIAKTASDARRQAALVAEYTNAVDEEAVQDLLDANVIGLTLTDYTDLDATGQTEVVAALLEDKAEFLTEELIQAAVTAAIAAAKPASDVRNETAWVAEYTNAASGAAVQELLNENQLGLTLTNYSGLDSTGVSEVRTALFNSRDTLTTKELIQTAVTEAIASAKPASDARLMVPYYVSQYRNASSVAAIQVLLSANVVGISVSAYLALDEIGKTAAATTLFSNRGYLYADGMMFQTDKAALEYQLGMAVGSQTGASNTRIAAAVTAINDAADEAAMATAITAHASTLGLVLTDYDALNNKVPVQTAMLTPTFANRAAVLAAFNDAVTAQEEAEQN